MMQTLLATLIAALPQAGTAAPRDAPSQRPLSQATLDDWATFIRPTGDELSFERIGWRNAFWPAIEEARELGRPVLLWTMNGHPLGCT